MADILSGIKSFKFIDIGTFKEAFPYFFWMFAIVFGLWFLFKLATHKIYVEKLINVQGGYVARGGRYKKVFNKENKQEYLKPMFGRGNLPNFPSSCFQKVRGIPFFGVIRELSLIMPNKYSPIVSLPGGRIMKIPVKRFFFLNEKTQFIKKFKSGNIAFFLSVYAPFVIILGAIIAWIIAIMLDVKNTELVASELQNLVKILTGVLK